MASNRSSSSSSAGGPSSKKTSNSSSSRSSGSISGNESVETAYAVSTFDEVTRVYTYCGGWVDIDDKIKKLIKNIVIEDGVTEIAEKVGFNADGKYWLGLFKNCTALTSITFPHSGTFVKIGYRALWGCRSLAALTVPDSCVDIGYAALCDCSSLTSFTFPNKCTKLSAYVLSGCASLTTLAIPNACTEIHVSAFLRCTALQALADKANITIEEYCRKQWRAPRLFAFKINLFASYNVLNGIRINGPLLNDPLIDNSSILWVMYDKITSDDVRRNIMEFLDYKRMGNK